MTDELIYLDSSAIVKLIVSEKETRALRDFLHQWPLRVSSAIHLASALFFKSLLGGMIVYDKRLLQAAEAHGLKGFSPV